MRSFLFSAAVLLAAPIALAADAPTLEERLRALEARLGAVERENAELRARLALEKPAPDTKLPSSAPAANGGNGHRDQGAGVVVPSGGETRLTIGGFTQAQMEFGGAGDQRFVGTADRIFIRRARMYFVANFAEHFEAKVEGEFGAGSSAATTGLRAQTNDTYLNWSRFPAFNVRVGQLKPAFAAELLAQEYRGPMVERSLGAERIGDSRQLGVSLHGELIPSRLSYVLLAGNGNGGNSSANDNSKFHQTAHVSAVAFDDRAAGKLTLGAGALHSRDNGVSKPGFALDAVAGGAVDNLFTGTRDGWGVDALWHWSLLELSSELLRMRFSPVNRVPDSHFDAEGWQLTAAVFVVPHQLQFAVRREHFDPNLSRRGDSTENWMAGFNYYFKGDDIRLVVDYLFGRAAAVPDNRGRLITRFQIVY